ncbi:unnamed protein product [Prorocentrum cordatum]|uniref:Uncharacterized protein n=1 Tax=Prorocentrum cordatum TaxID=2364126 RepID=A0ABN9WTS7_9DINO|nr:unnamed protein product [Polarella glacialis]
MYVYVCMYVEAAGCHTPRFSRDTVQGRLAWRKGCAQTALARESFARVAEPRRQSSSAARKGREQSPFSTTSATTSARARTSEEHRVSAVFLAPPELGSSGPAGL